ncbi:hypothetical protein [Mucilaginibacter segetis]|uniref:Exostosin family protein n=1 Tax=Mucilaginibacter segetis TaxID=2793071 RepID=A0A934ULD0_9SPHI|nr:hypothetical protein [Mucilaginibacter segetis]MBK0378204.1 hypothetical protein [Mucilaginibacter segetis]
MSLIQLNKFGTLHNGSDIIFCKTELLKSEFKKIAEIKNNVILISGNSDDPVDIQLSSKMPENILHWYCQNNEVFNDRLTSIPIGLENTFTNKRTGHGVAWPHAREKIKLLNDVIKVQQTFKPNKLVYANFNVITNKSHRLPIADLCKKNTFITWHEPLLKYSEFIKQVLNHEATICPAGNGIDTHRLYEVLYCDRVAITIKTGNYAIYNSLYEKLPIVILNNIEDLYNKDKISQLINDARIKKKSMNLLDFNYWEKLILESSSNIVKKPTIQFKVKQLITDIFRWR